MSKVIIFFLLNILILVTQEINIPLCTSGGIDVYFKDAQGVSDGTTRAHLCHDKMFLYVNWENADSQIISTYTNCNDPLFKEDVVEVFFSSPSVYPRNYYEIQVSPKGNIFISNITNYSGNCSNFTQDYKNCNIVQAYGKIFSNGWEAQLKVDLNIIGRDQGSNTLYGNLFRIDYTTNKPTRYLAMNPTMTSTPCFHVPSKFQKFVLLNYTRKIDEKS